MSAAEVFADGLLRGRAALITGGGSGIGAGIARRLAAQGAKVALLGRTAAKLEAVQAEIAAAGGEALAVSADVRDYPAVAAAVERCAGRFGGIDILVCSAAGNFLAPAAGLSANGFRAVIDIDLCGTFNAARAACARLAERRGCIVNVSATQAFVPTPLQAHAGAAKAGIEKLTRDLALEWAPSGVRVNSVVPGPIEAAERESVGRAAAKPRPATPKRGAAERLGSARPKRASDARKRAWRAWCRPPCASA